MLIRSTFTRVSTAMLTRDIDIAVLSVRPSVCLSVRRTVETVTVSIDMD